MTTLPRDWGILAALALPLFGLLPTFQPGIMDAADAPLHVQRIFAMGTLLASGELYPRWVNWFHLGYGYPVFNFYPPGVFYLGGLLMGVGVSAVQAFHIVAACAWAWGTVGTYRLARTLLPGSAALVAAALWAYAPSRLFEVWTQGSLPQMLSAAFIPWVFLTVITTAMRPSRRASVWVALALFGLVMTHQPMTFLTALVVAPLTVILLVGASWGRWETLRGRAVSLYGGIALGAGLCLIFLLPVALELPLVEAAGGTDDLAPYLQSNFLTLGEAVSYPLAPDLTDIRMVGPRTLGAVGLVLFALGVVRFGITGGMSRAGAVLLSGGLLLVGWMLLAASAPVWFGVPYLAQLRFPERFLRVGAVLAAMGGGASVLWVAVRWRGIIAALLVALVVGTTLPQTVPSQPFLRYDNLTARSAIDFERTYNTWGTTSYNEFNPRWGASVPLDPPVDPHIYETLPRRIYPLRYWPYEQVTAQSFRLTVDQEMHSLVIRQFYYPGWTATVNGNRVPITPEPEHGLITVDVPRGEHVVALHYRGTLAQHAGTTLTLVSAVLALGLYHTGRPQPPLTSGDGVRLPAALGAMLLITALAGVWAFYIVPGTAWLRVASPPGAPTYMTTPFPATFGDQFDLLGYTLPRDIIRAGEPFALDLFWRPTADFDGQRVRAVVQLVNLDLSGTWAVSQPVFLGGGHTDSPEYTLNRFTSDRHTLRLFDHAEPHVAQIMVQLVDEGTGEPLLHENGSDRVLLPETITVITEDDGPQVRETLNVTFGDSLKLMCASVDVGDTTTDITLYWGTQTPVTADLTTLIHALDAEGTIIAQGDAPPIRTYPTQFWREGQRLTARHTVPTDPATIAIGVGLYDASGVRRSARTADNAPVPDNRVLIPLTRVDCVTGA